ncbi:leupaxin-like isoform X2 [Coccinella septempunctata]|uniref:leupaxin-like isoform X2 n=1 Tax=Coccinella septempunctata TaxID=41139 RepID=UPI001D062A8A|nr:leupaxin-like isoform X2 [Coccinella septempunctata]
MPEKTVEKCAGCRKPITKNYVFALGKKWHKNGLPYCRNDFLELFHHRCSKCNEHILTEAVEAFNKFWHVNCFTCTTCQKPIKPPLYFVKDGKPYCIEDYEKNFAPKCKGCGEYIFEDHLKVLGGMWHFTCFVCKDCKKQIEKKYFLIDNKPVCEACIDSNKDKSRRCYQSCCSFHRD